MDEHFLLVIVRQHQSFTKSPFNSYTKQFVSTPDRGSAEDQFWRWWLNLDPKSYTRRMCNVQFLWCSMESINLLSAPNAEVIPLQRKKSS